MNDVRPADEHVDERAAKAEETAREPIIHLGEAGGRPVVELEGGSSLTSVDVDERRAALAALAERGLADADVEPVSRLLLDPRPDIRRTALEAMAAAGRLRGPVLYKALQDPTDEVRGAAVRAAAARGAQYFTELSTLVAARNWPLTQRAALEVVPELIERSGTTWERELSMLLLAIAQMPSPPVDREHVPFAELARAIGVDRLAERLRTQDRRRLGAVRLLMEEGSPVALRAVAPLGSDEIEEIRIAASAAVNLLALVPEPAAAPVPSVAPQGSLAERSDEEEMIAALAHVMRDPDQTVRDRAWTALAKTNWAALLAWMRDTLRAGDAESAGLAAHVAERLMLSQAAPAILKRAAEAPAEARGPFVSALASFALEPSALAGALADIETETRPEAVGVVWQVGGRAVLPHLRSAMKDPYGPVRLAVLEVFDGSRDPATTELAREVLRSDASSAIRARAVRTLAHAGREERLEAVREALADPHPDVRLAGVEVLFEAPDEDALPHLIEALGDPEELVWGAALRRLAEARDDEGLWAALRRCRQKQREQLEGLLQRTHPERMSRLWRDHAQAKEGAERALALELAAGAGAGDPECLPAAIWALRDPTAPVRRAAIAVLSRQRDPTAVDALGRALNDPDPAVRVGAVRALGDVDDEGVLGFLVSALKDPEVWVRDVAGETLSRWRSPAVAARLAAVLPVPGLRTAAAELLANMGASAVEPLIDLLPQPDPEMARIVGELLLRIAGLRPFVDRLTSMEPEERLRAEEAVGAIGGPSAVDALVAMLSDPDERLRVRALQLLGSLGDERALDAIGRSAATDPIPEVVAAAEEAAARLAPHE